jgi:hypothetical protein
MSCADGIVEGLEPLVPWLVVIAMQTKNSLSRPKARSNYSGLANKGTPSRYIKELASSPKDKNTRPGKWTTMVHSGTMTLRRTTGQGSAARNHADKP